MPTHRFILNFINRVTKQNQPQIPIDEIQQQNLFPTLQRTTPLLPQTPLPLLPNSPVTMAAPAGGTAYITHKDMLKHSPKVVYESADRIEEIMKYVEKELLLTSCVLAERYNWVEVVYHVKYMSRKMEEDEVCVKWAAAHQLCVGRKV